MIFKTVFHEFAHRLQQETPVFFKKVRSGGVWLAGVGASMNAPEILHVKLPAILDSISTWGTHLLGIGTVMAVVASAAVKKPGEVPEAPAQ